MSFYPQWFHWLSCLGSTSCPRWKPSIREGCWFHLIHCSGKLSTLPIPKPFHHQAETKANQKPLMLDASESKPSLVDLWQFLLIPGLLTPGILHWKPWIQKWGWTLPEQWEGLSDQRCTCSWHPWTCRSVAPRCMHLQRISPIHFFLFLKLGNNNPSPPLNDHPASLFVSLSYQQEHVFRLRDAPLRCLQSLQKKQWFVQGF